MSGVEDGGGLLLVSDDGALSVSGVEEEGVLPADCLPVPSKHSQAAENNSNLPKICLSSLIRCMSLG